MIDSYYNGVRYSYLMYKNGAGINIDKLGEFPTKERNGVAVKVELSINRDIYRQLKLDFSTLAFFNCLYIQDNGYVLDGFAQNFNKRGTKMFKHLAFWNMIDMPRVGYYDDVTIKLVVGNVIYPLEKKSLIDDIFDQCNYPIYLKFDIGDLDVTPNRENILYNAKTENKIIEVSRKALEELKEYIRQTSKFDFPDVIQWYKFTASRSLEMNIPLSYDQNVNFYIKGDLLNKISLSNMVTLKGKPADKELYKICDNLAHEMVHRNSVTLVYKPSNVMKFTKLGVNSWFNKNLKDLVLENTSQFNYFTMDSFWSTSTKEYAMEHILKKYSNSYNCYIFNVPKILKIFKEYYKDIINSNAFNKELVKFVIKDILEQKYFTVFSSADVPQKWLDERDAKKKVEAKTNKVITVKADARKCVIRTLVESSRYNYGECRYAAMLNDTMYTFDQVKKMCNATFIYTDNTPENIEYLKALYHIVRAINDNSIDENYKFISVAASNIPVIENLSNTIEMNAWINSNVKCFRNRTSLDKNFKQLLHMVSGRISDDFPQLYNRIQAYCLDTKEGGKTGHLTTSEISILDEIIEKYKENNWINQDIIDLQSDEKVKLLFKWLEGVSYNYTTSARLIICDYILRTGVSNVSNSLYKIYLNSEFYKSIAIKTN